MNRISRMFLKNKESVLSIYMTAGFPGLNDTENVLKSLQEAGVDMVEIGMPFSDPLADGPVIQKSSQKALENGMSIRVLFEQLEGIRKDVTIPLILMGYLNPVLQYGFKEFLKRCHKIGIDGLIIPDLPPGIYEQEYRQLFIDSGLEFIMLITPQTSDDRIHQIVKANSSTQGSFLYMVADSSTTGAKNTIGIKQLEYFQRIQEMEIDIPRLIGFGISNADTFKQASSYSNGAIIGSAFIEAIGKESEESLGDKITDFIKTIRPRNSD